MIKALIFDFSRVLLFPKGEYVGSLNDRHRTLSSQFDYRILDHFVLNAELLGYLKTLKDKYELYIFTSETAMHETGEFDEYLLPIFKDIISGLDLRLPKNTPEAYKIVLEKIGKQPEEVIFVDDSPDNVAAAQSIGINVIRFQNNAQLFSELDKKLKMS